MAREREREREREIRHAMYPKYQQHVKTDTVKSRSRVRAKSSPGCFPGCLNHLANRQFSRSKVRRQNLESARVC